MDTRILKPRVNDKGQPLNPEELPALRIYQRYARFRKLGRTEEEAAELALREVGKCQEVENGIKCGAVAVTARAFRCEMHKKKNDLARAKAARKKGNHFVPRVCQVCGKEFKGHRLRKNCDKHTQVRLEKRSDAGKKHAKRVDPAASPAMRDHAAAYVKSGNPNLPDTWDRPLPEHLREQPKPAPVVVPPGFKVTFLSMPGREK